VLIADLEPSTSAKAADKELRGQLAGTGGTLRRAHPALPVARMQPADQPNWPEH
jgi:hypothetical protein